MDAEQLQSIPLFEGVDASELDAVAARFQTAEMVAGSSLAKQDDFAYKFFVVLDGDAEVYRDFEHVADLAPGDFFGEMGLLGGERRNARVTAKTRVDLAWMMPWDFETMLEESPAICARIQAAVAERTPSDDA